MRELSTPVDGAVGTVAVSWLRFWRQTAGRRHWLYLALGAALMRAMLAVATTMFLARLAQGLRSGAWTQLVLAAASVLASAIVGYGSRIVVTRAVKDYITSLRNTLVTRILAMPIDRLHYLGPDALRISTVRDCETLDTMLSAIVAIAFPALVMAGVAMIGVAVLAPRAVLPLAMVFLAGLLLRRLWARHLHRQLASSNLAVALLDEKIARLVRRHELAVSSAREDFEAALCAQAIEETSTRKMTAVRKIALVGELDGLAMGWALIGGIALLSIDAADATFWARTVPALFLLVLLRNAMHALSQAARDMGEGCVASERITALLAEASAAPATGKLTPRTWQVSAKDLTFARDRSPVLQGVTLTLDPGKITLVSGANGSGKTTLIRLLLGLYTPGRGSLDVDGKALGSLDQAAFRRGIGYLPQAPVFMADTICANVAYGQPDADPAVVAGALDMVGLTDAISALPDGIWTTLDDRGSPLSGGQRQRLALARALYGHPQLLLLDEPTNHLDQTGRDTVASLMRHWQGAPAVLIISHDSALTDIADHHFRLVSGSLEPAEVVR